MLMKTFRFLICVYFLSFSFTKINAEEFVCFYLMNTEIKHSVEENVRQNDMRDGSVVMNGIETYNNEEFKKMKETSQKIKERLSGISLLMQSIPFGWNISRYISGTYEYQSKIYQELSDAPAFVIIAIPDQISFVEQLQQNTLFIYGIIASYGVINDMESKERRILLKFAEEEFEALYFKAMQLYSKIRTAKSAFQWKKQMLWASIKEDKRMFDEILQQF